MAKKTNALRESAEDKLGRESFIALFLAVRQACAEVEALCREEQIAMSHYTVLWFLARRREREGVPMGAVIDGHLNRASDSTRLADRLTALGMIERLASEADRRVVLVRLTARGRDALSTAHAAHSGVAQTAMEWTLADRASRAAPLAHDRCRRGRVARKAEGACRRKRRSDYGDALGFLVGSNASCRHVDEHPSPSSVSPSSHSSAARAVMRWCSPR
jgi:DNA-binding MarR family transcriptional regulator